MQSIVLPSGEPQIFNHATPVAITAAAAGGAEVHPAGPILAKQAGKDEMLCPPLEHPAACCGAIGRVTLQPTVLGHWATGGYQTYARIQPNMQIRLDILSR